MGRAEGRKKETIGRRVAGKRERPKKEREFHLQIHSYIIQCLSSWEMDLCSLHLTLSHPSVHSSPRWREMSSEPGSFQRQDVGRSCLAYMNTMRGISYFSLTEINSLFLLRNGFCPVVSNVQSGNLMKSHSSKFLGRTTTRPPPTSLLLGQSSPGSTILKLREKKQPPEIHQRRCAVSDLTAFLPLLPFWCLSLGPQTQHGWFSGQSHCNVLNFSFLLKKINKVRGKKKLYTHVSQHFQKAFCCIYISSSASVVSLDVRQLED